jgi:hypothetical protein
MVDSGEYLSLTPGIEKFFAHDLPPKKAAIALSQRRCLRSVTFERPSACLGDPDAAHSLPASLDLALYCCKSGAPEAH